MLDFYFALRNFLNIYDLVDDHYVIYSQMTEEGQPDPALLRRSVGQSAEMHR